MRSDELVDRARKAAGIGSAAAWPDWPDSRVLAELTERHCSLMGEEEIRARAGYGVQFEFRTCAVGQQMYPVPSRAVGGAFENLCILLPGAVTWTPLDRAEVYGSELFDMGLTKPGRPLRYVVEDGFVRLMPSPDAAYTIRFAFYIRPSQLVTSQSSALGGDGVLRGLITDISAIASRQVTFSTVPFDQSLSPPAAITSGNQTVDVVRPNGTFALAAYSLVQTFSGAVMTFGGTQSLQRVRVGDFIRVADQTDWPMGLPQEAHRMVANRAAAEIVRDIGVEEKIQSLAQVVEADLKRFRNSSRPQVKSQPKVLPLLPMSRR
jgi:hypothetical protein